MSISRDVVAHLRVLRASCARGMAWCSALIWAEKALLLSDDIDDLLWLVDALVTNGQYRQAEELLVNPLYASRARASAAGRYLASVVAMRLGRAEDALELLSIDTSRHGNTAESGRSGAMRAEFAGSLTPTTKGITGSNGSDALTAALPLFDQSAVDVAKAESQRAESKGSTNGPMDLFGCSGIPPLNPRAWMLYMQGAAVVQLSNVGASDTTPSIKLLSAQLPQGNLESKSFGGLGTSSVTSTAGRPTIRHNDSMGTSQLGGMDALVARLWTEAVQTDARCWEAWTGLRDHGLLTNEEETELVNRIDWSACCGGSSAVGQFFQNYCMATQTAFSLGDVAVHATERLLSLYPRIARDPALRTIQAARLLAMGRARECLTYTVSVLEHRRVPDSGATAIHITALTVLHAREALFRIAHELAEEFGLSAIKRAEIEPSDTGTVLGSGHGPRGGSLRSSAGGVPASTPRGPAVGAATAGASRLRAGARGLLVPETPSKTGSGSIFASGAGTTNSTRRQGAPGSTAHTLARSVAQSAPETATAVWRGLWGLPTWTHPGPPVLATYPSALGPAQAAPVNSESAVSTLGTFTTANAQSVGSPTQYEFIGASLAWYAIGCYYLVSAALMAAPAVSQREWPLSGMIYGDGLAAASAGNFGHGGGNANPAAILRRSQPLAPEAEHALSEARRWLAKTTLASPRSIVAWVAFAHTFIVAGEWESATRALHTAVGLCGCEGVIHGGGRDSAALDQLSNRTPSKQSISADSDLLDGGMHSSGHDAAFERGSQLAHAPLASLGGVYLQMGDLGISESCLDASARCLSGFRISDWLAAWKPILGSVPNIRILSWCASEEAAKTAAADHVRAAAISDPQLLNDIGVLYYNCNELANARCTFMLALLSLESNSSKQHALHNAFNPSTRKAGRQKPPPEVQAYRALLKANLGNALRRMGYYDAALECFRAAILHAPSDTDIMLSMAFTLHARVIEGCSVSGAAEPASTMQFCADLDQAIDMYHQILADRPGDPATTDLLSLALELSTNIGGIRRTGDPLALGEEFNEIKDLFTLRSPDEIGLFDPTFVQNPQHSDSTFPSEYESQGEQQLYASQVSQQETESIASVAEDSDDVMDIEDDSGSDMAME
ncbi:anaphase-promoting complex subunit Cut9 [Coemansia sp. RSA 988]|nr:anaphase-promoting complex subunit Cut9 [Coemansia sp. RSA 988]